MKHNQPIFLTYTKVIEQEIVWNNAISLTCKIEHYVEIKNGIYKVCDLT